MYSTSLTDLWFGLTDKVRTWGRWDGSGTERKHYLPRSPLSAAAGIAVAAGYQGDYMQTHSLPRDSVAVPDR